MNGTLASLLIDADDAELAARDRKLDITSVMTS